MTGIMTAGKVMSSGSLHYTGVISGRVNPVPVALSWSKAEVPI